MARISVVGNRNLETTVRVVTGPAPHQPTTFLHFGIRSMVSGIGGSQAHALMMLGDTVALASLTGAGAAVGKA